jgi:hypothetical protein
MDLDAVPLRMLSPLDGVRSALFRALGPSVGVWAARRDLRVAAIGLVAMTTALFGAAFIPVWMLALGPIVLGVPHIVADLRYLVAKPGFHRRGLGAVAIGAALAGGALTGRLWPGIVAVLITAFVARGHFARRGIVVALGLAWLAVTWRYRGYSEFAFAHAHNLIAVLLFWSWRDRGASSLHRVPLAFFVAVVAMFALGIFDKSPLRAPVFGATLQGFVSDLGAGLSGPWGLRLVLIYAFAQSVHYGVWLRLVPEEDRERPGPRSFTSSYRALVRDVGRPLLLIALVSIVALVAWAVVDLMAARNGYLRVAIFHGPLELVAAAFFFIERQTPASASARGLADRNRTASAG